MSEGSDAVCISFASARPALATRALLFRCRATRMGSGRVRRCVTLSRAGLAFPPVALYCIVLTPPYPGTIPAGYWMHRRDEHRKLSACRGWTGARRRHKLRAFAQAFFAGLTGQSFVPLGGVRDGGADALSERGLFQAGPPDHFWQAWIQATYEAKIRNTTRRLREFGRVPKQLTYCTSRIIPTIDVLEDVLVQNSISACGSGTRSTSFHTSMRCRRRSKRSIPIWLRS